jgi:hypothetical protein
MTTYVVRRNTQIGHEGEETARQRTGVIARKSQLHMNTSQIEYVSMLRLAAGSLWRPQKNAFGDHFVMALKVQLSLPHSTGQTHHPQRRLIPETNPERTGVKFTFYCNNEEKLCSVIGR